MELEIGYAHGPCFKYRPFFAANDMTNDFIISYWQQAKKEIPDDISAGS